MLAAFGALLAGALTTLAPCVLPLLPVIVGSSLTPGSESGRSGPTGLVRVLVITASLGASIVAFTLLLKASTAALSIPQEVWQYISGGLLIVLGLFGAFPTLWERISTALNLQSTTTDGLASARQRGGLIGLIFTGGALGPVFTSCSPLYGYVVVTVLPANFGYGLFLLALYAIGLCGTLLGVALVGRSAISKLGWAADTDGWFRRGLGAVFILVGIGVLTSLDKELQTWIILHSPVRPWELDSGFIPN